MSPVPPDRDEGREARGPVVPDPSEAIGADLDEGPIGPFPTWRWLYATVLVWAALQVTILWVLTRTLDHGAP